MKKVLISLFATVAMGQMALATGLHMPVFSCSSVMNGPAWSLDHFSTSAPGGPVHSWYELSRSVSPTGQVATFRLIHQETIQSPDGSTTLMKFVNGEPNGYGVFTYLSMNGRTFVAAHLGATFPGGKLDTNGLIELGEGYVCSNR
ncbi:MAG: hypothetical protein H6624_12250 [Bdellovibrionaceae bacterium]|nr:hypothetical protein [Bdellovibrionales bacterium]MCB9085114.1 hypothetical protein [Pseudobdellovibrionaceae bacterium]